MSAVRTDWAEPDSLIGGWWAMEVLVNTHSEGKDPIKVCMSFSFFFFLICISDLHVQANKQRHGPLSLSKKGFQAGATAGAEAKCY